MTSLHLGLDEIKDFQGNLKELSKANYEKLKASLIKYGYTFPSFVWKHTRTGEWMTIDAHQRNSVCRLLVKDGWAIEGNAVPCVEILAADEKEAKAKILLATSQYGKTTDEGLYEFIHHSNLDFGILKTEIDLPQIDLGRFEMGYMVDKQPEAKNDSKKDATPLKLKAAIELIASHPNFLLRPRHPDYAAKVNEWEVLARALCAEHGVEV